MAVCLWFCCDCEYATVEELPGAEQFKLYLKVMLRVAEVNAEERRKTHAQHRRIGHPGKFKFYFNGDGDAGPAKLRLKQWRTPAKKNRVRRRTAK